MLKAIKSNDNYDAAVREAATKTESSIKGGNVMMLKINNSDVQVNKEATYNTAGQSEIIADKQSPAQKSLIPEDFSDIGQAKVIARKYGSRLLYTSATSFLYYNGVFWEESEQKAKRAVIAFLDEQLKDANEKYNAAINALVGAGLQEQDIVKERISSLTAEKNALYEAFKKAKSYKAFVGQRRNAKYISSALQVLEALVNTDVSALDSNPFLLNTPSYTFDLTKGTEGRREHNPADRITKVTACDPSDKGKDLWLSALKDFFGDDAELIEYVQQIFGQAIIGRVFAEHLVIAYGKGCNGKSTFGNAIFEVLGSYAGVISADALTAGCRRNIKPELAEVKGKRLVVASELEEGAQLSTSIVKQLCSTDNIEAEKKYKDPFSFRPSHTVLLYTNHLPKIAALDDGIWRRILVIPFESRISENCDVKNYAEFLAENAGGYILKWLIEGAAKSIMNGFKPRVPACVKESLSKYRDDNDWAEHFIVACCDIGEGFTAKSGEVYQTYRKYCDNAGDQARSTTDFYNALTERGIIRKKTSKGNILIGIRLKEDTES